MKSIKYINKKNFPPFLFGIYEISPDELPITAYARLTCQNCGIYNRAILCPPLLYQTYPQYSTIESSIKYALSFSKAFVYVFKNNGSKRFWYKKDQDQYSHLRLRVVSSGKELKGIESVSARYLTQMMFKIRKINRKIGYRVETYIQGHCDFCARKCPRRENPPCKLKGMPSLEAIGINVYSLLEQLGVEYEYPVMSYLTQVTLMLLGGRKGRKGKK